MIFSKMLQPSFSKIESDTFDNLINEDNFRLRPIID